MPEKELLQKLLQEKPRVKKQLSALAEEGIIEKKGRTYRVP
jgi:hypothetical protein